LDNNLAVTTPFCGRKWYLDCGLNDKKCNVQIAARIRVSAAINPRGLSFGYNEAIQAIKMIGFGLKPMKKMGFMQRKFHIDRLQLGRLANQNDRVSARVNKIKQIIGRLLA